MRIVLVGRSHWHTPFYSDPVLGMKDATIVGVSDPDAEGAAPLAAPGGNVPFSPATGSVREAEARPCVFESRRVFLSLLPWQARCI
jgi:hypothetical protein